LPGYSCTAGDLPGELRLDRYVAENLKLLSRSQIKARHLEAKINGKKVKVSRPVREGDLLELFWDDRPREDLVPEDLPLDILYEDSRVVVVNKAQGMVVHPGAGNPRGTLANALLYRRQKKEALGPISPGLRTGIVHRLDKDTSGVIIAAWDDEALEFLASQFRTRTVKKVYAAIVRGCPRASSGLVESPIIRDPRDRKKFALARDKGKSALTFFRLIRSWDSHSLLLVRPKTGRTHQIRLHLRSLGHPILGDPLYGAADSRFPRAALMLHAKSLSIVLPGAEEKSLFKTPLPSRFREIFRSLGSAD
jgi:23S rRNA pseudouridine1911/1915/1917 synthase